MPPSLKSNSKNSSTSEIRQHLQRNRSRHRRMASTGMGAAGIQRNRPIPISRPATPLPGYPESWRYHENRLEPVCGSSRHCCRRIALSVLLCRRQARRTRGSFRTHVRIHSSGTRTPSTLVCLGERPRSVHKRAGGGLSPAPVRDGCARVWSGMASIGCAVFRCGPTTRACVPCWKSWNHALRGSTF